MEQMNAQKLGEITMFAVNSYSFNDAEYAEVVSHEHRTLQQSWMRMAMATIRTLAALAEMGAYDERNEATVMLAKKIVEAIGDDTLPLI